MKDNIFKPIIYIAIILFISFIGYIFGIAQHFTTEPIIWEFLKNGTICFDIAGALAFWLLWRELKHKEKEKDELKEHNKKLQEQNAEIQKMQQFQKDLAFAQEVELEMFGFFELFINHIDNITGSKIKQWSSNTGKDYRNILRTIIYGSSEVFDEIGRCKKEPRLNYKLAEFCYLDFNNKVPDKYQPLYQKLTTIKTDEIREIYTSEDSIFKQLFNKCVEFENIAKSEFTNPK